MYSTNSEYNITLTVCHKSVLVRHTHRLKNADTFITMESNLLWLNSICTRLYLFFGRHSPTSSRMDLLCDEPLIIISYLKRAVIQNGFLQIFKKKIQMKPNWNVEARTQSTDQSPRLLWAVKQMWLIPESFSALKSGDWFSSFSH